MFIRSDSLLTEDDFVPFEAQPLSKFGPISRFIGPTSTVNKTTSSAGYSSNQNAGCSQSEV